MTDKRFLKFIEEILDIEGGYSNRKNDRGGKTRYGITEKTARLYGYKGKMSELPLETAIEIYKVLYWENTKIYHINDDNLAFECFDNAINMGSYKAVKVLQQAFNIINFNDRYGKDLKVDGQLGPLTLGRINTHPEPVRILKLINGFQAKHYIELALKYKSQRSNIWGWINKRVSI
jgi:lysozyme family protein